MQIEITEHTDHIKLCVDGTFINSFFNVSKEQLFAHIEVLLNNLKYD